jgi:uncharacterized protein YxeA
MKKVLIVLVILVALFVGVVFVSNNITTERHNETYVAGYRPVKTLVVEITNDD